MLAVLPKLIPSDFPPIHRGRLETLQVKYPDVWKPLRKHFDPNRPVWNGE
jgi:hypothetical protein